jgi:hypothetical protein
MKKFKLMFTAVAVFAVVGSSLALSANYRAGAFRCRAVGTGAGACPTPIQKFIVVTQGGETRFCNNGTNSDTNCNIQRQVTVNPN